MRPCPSCGEPKDNPEDDATDAAHPAWWRGHHHGAKKVAELLYRIAVEGAREGAQYSAPVAQVVLEIIELRKRVHELEAQLAADLRRP